MEITQINLLLHSVTQQFHANDIFHKLPAKLQILFLLLVYKVNATNIVFQ